MPCRQQPGCEGAAPTTERARAVWMRQQHRIHTGPLLHPRAHRPAPTRPCPAPRRCRSSQHGIGDPERVAGQTASPGAHTHAPARPPPHGCRTGGRTCCRPLRAPARPAQAPHRRPLLAWRRRTKIDGPGSRTISIQTSHAPRVIVTSPCLLELQCIHRPTLPICRYVTCHEVILTDDQPCPR